MSEKFDVVVLGTGNAGLGAAGVAHEAGKSVAIVESWDVGGTCALRGCMPKKVLVAAAQVLDQIDRAPAHHIRVDGASLDWGALIARERAFIEPLPGAFEKSLEDRGIALVRGRARFIGRNRVAVGARILEADKIVIATGSTPRRLDLPGAEHLITSDDLLEMATLPETLVFIGGGVIALEFAHVLARAGTKVTILEALPRLLPRMDSGAVDALRAESERIGIEVLTGVDVKEISLGGNALEVRFSHDGTDKSIVADRVANGTGRVPNVETLDLAAGDIGHHGTRIEVDDFLRSTTNPDVFVAGDALWKSAQLSPVATYEGRLVGKNLVNGRLAAPDYSAVPSAVYTVPALASVGLTEDEAQGLDVEVKTTDMTGWLSSRTHAENAAFSKIIVERGTGRIVGAHIVGHAAEEIIHLFAFAIAHDVTADALKASIYAYPTFASDVKSMI